eukprot:scaffold461_cov157-Ochromonas_danica.AAC.5
MERNGEICTRTVLIHSDRAANVSLSLHNYLFDANHHPDSNHNLTMMKNSSSVMPPENSHWPIACVFIKNINSEWQRECERNNATVYLDVIDSSIINILVQAINGDRNVKRYLPHCVYLVQSKIFADQLIQAGFKAYSYPHHHSNFGKWGIAPVLDLSSDSKLTVGFLEGNSLHHPHVDILITAVCKVNGIFVLINQGIGETDSLNTVNSIARHYNCSKLPNGDYIYIEKKYSTKVIQSADKFNQAVFYLDEAFNDIHIAVAWPSKSMDLNDPSSHKDLYRPSTRLLHWMSRGVPTLYFPTYSALEVIQSSGLEKGLNFSLAVRDVDTLCQGIQNLLDLAMRREMHYRSLQAASQFDLESTALRLVRIVTSSI